MLQRVITRVPHQARRSLRPTTNAARKAEMHLSSLNLQNQTFRPAVYKPGRRTEGVPEVEDEENVADEEDYGVIDSREVVDEPEPEPEPAARERRSTGSRSPYPLYGIYKPTREPGRGCAAQISYDSHRKSIFLSMAPQLGPKLPPGQSGQQFEWEKKIVFKMDLVDMVKFLSALEGKYPAQRPNQHGQAPTTELNILHESTGRSEAPRYTTFRVRPNQGRPGVVISLARATGNEKTALAVGMDEYEMRTTRIFLEEGMRRALGFEAQAQAQQQQHQSSYRSY